MNGGVTLKHVKNRYTLSRSLVMSGRRKRTLKIEAGLVCNFFLNEGDLIMLLGSKEEGITIGKHYGGENNKQNSTGDKALKYRLRKGHRKEKGNIIHLLIHSYLQKTFTGHLLYARHCSRSLGYIHEENTEACLYEANVLARLIERGGYNITKNIINI